MYFTLKVPVIASQPQSKFNLYEGLTALAVGVNEADRHEVVLGVQSAPVGYREWLVRDGVTNRAPHVNDAHTTLQEPVGVGAKVTVNTSDARVECLVDVNAFLYCSISGMIFPYS